MFGHDLIDTAANWSGHGKCHTVAKVHPWTREVNFLPRPISVICSISRTSDLIKKHIETSLQIKIRSKIASGGMATLDNG
ncbi:hypothetical protein T4E_6197 [Trichinella pseudospiralis]|uniref:Uncharacterized protein n=1 Tax=Trichinella pseudospiralis TaxID=6337 RepID=A0A0V0Y9Z9_TRIPS|nr:hypothetical protein T4E_6197 [Trichinella pseudospiralis]